MRFTIFTHVEHNFKDDSYIAYAPYVREMNIWIANFEEVEIVAPLQEKTLTTVEFAYKHSNLNFTSITSFDLLSFKSAIKASLNIPFICYSIYNAMKRSDHIHIRNPGNVGLLATFIQILFPNKKKTAKYAGNWDPKSRQPYSYRLQKWILSNRFLTRNIKVLVYGEWANQNINIMPFFTASFSGKILTKNSVRKYNETYQFIFVGSLVDGKRPQFAIDLINELNNRGFKSQLKIYGEGDLKKELLNKYKELDFITIVGNVDLNELEDIYRKSDFLILPSKSEGWPKAIAEAMFFGVIPIATAVSCVPYMLDYGNRGMLINPELEQATHTIISYLKNKESLIKMSEMGLCWSRKFTLERFEKEIFELI